MGPNGSKTQYSQEKKKKEKKWSLKKENFGRTWREERRVMENLRKSYGELERPPSTWRTSRQKLDLETPWGKII